MFYLDQDFLDAVLELQDALADMAFDVPPILYSFFRKHTARNSRTATAHGSLILKHCYRTGFL